MKQSETANRLLNESSPYLQQHAYNPVDWYPWGEEALKKAIDEDKPILVSVGYSACHWCHVMERESFEKDDIAKIMNEHFVCIKVDREERPDVDQIYMDAIQAMGIQGGWPMNVFLTPEQKPFYGGTYFPPDSWAQLLKNVATAFKSNRKELEESAEGFTESLALSEVTKYGLADGESNFAKADLDAMYQKMAQRFDKVKGGMDKAPKFPMPANWKFIARYFSVRKDDNALKQLKLTLTQMAYGGIYDQIGGGFSRYSVDAQWLAPHFEKMLYDNGQLTSLYSEAYILTKDSLYKKVVFDTIGFVERELTDPDGGFYSALDADSEGEEGKFYVWKYKEFEAILGKDAALMAKYYNLVPHGNWEHGNNILHRNKSDQDFSATNDIELSDLQQIVAASNEKLMLARSKRTRPGLDDKILTGWNGLMLKGLCDAYAVFGEQKFKDLALRNAAFIESKLKNGKGLKRNYKNGKATFDAYLEDYAFVIEAYISLYQVTFDEKWIQRAADLTDYTLENFYDESENLFFYTDKNSEKLIARKKEIFDNVIPSSSSAMASNLYQLGLILDIPGYIEISESMVAKVSKLIKLEPSYLSNWACLYANLVTPTAEIAIVGDEAEVLRQSFESYYYPNKIIVGTKDTSTLPLLESRKAINNKTTIYVCFNKTCKLPVHNVEDAFAQLST